MTETNLFMVYNDETGSFVDIREIQTVQAYDEPNPNNYKSLITLRDHATSLRSPLKPRELLRRISIIRYKHGQSQSGEPSAGAVPAKPESAAEVAKGRKLPEERK
jgi:hypothetical protein